MYWAWFRCSHPSCPCSSTLTRAPPIHAPACFDMTVEGEKNVFYTTVSFEWHQLAAGCRSQCHCGCVMTLFLDISLSASPKTIQSPLWSTFWSLAFVGIVLVLLGLPALYLHQAGGRGGVLGTKRAWPSSVLAQPCWVSSDLCCWGLRSYVRRSFPRWSASCSWLQVSS